MQVINTKQFLNDADGHDYYNNYMLTNSRNTYNDSISL